MSEAPYPGKARVLPELGVYTNEPAISACQRGRYEDNWAHEYLTTIDGSQLYCRRCGNVRPLA